MKVPYNRQADAIGTFGLLGDVGTRTSCFVLLDICHIGAFCDESDSWSNNQGDMHEPLFITIMPPPLHVKGGRVCHPFDDKYRVEEEVRE